MDAMGWTRRDFLAGSSATLWTSAAWTSAGNAAEDNSRRRPLRVAAINSVFRLRSHAYHIVGRIVHGYHWNGFPHRPDMRVVRMFNDQTPPDDLSEEFCRRHQIELCRSAREALGGDRLDVDAVLLIIEHGNYPINDRKQVQYPRFEYFQQIVEAFRHSGRTVPVFVDKHLSYDHRQAAQMMRQARDLGIPLMAGSSLPVTWRIPELEPPLNTPFREGLVTFGFDRGVPEIYLIHALESLQCFLERRAGGETGVRSVQCLEGDAVWRAADEGRWSWKLCEAALARCQSENVGPIRENVRNPLALLVEYNDGTRGAVLNLIEQTSEFAFAGFVEGASTPVSTCLYLPQPPAAKFFDPLTWHIEQFFLSGTPTYPVERTWLTTTVLDLGLQSQQEGYRVVTAPELDIRYQPPRDSGFARGSFVRGV
uniref:Twin-arginine translocation signal domain-containing protein n=1 Tax=Schlesneria paludicola TaxID=360056 RepID=A0A7C4QKH5_9PLAN